jgi:hypothetical protein
MNEFTAIVQETKKSKKYTGTSGNKKVYAYIRHFVYLPHSLKVKKKDSLKLAVISKK